MAEINPALEIPRGKSRFMALPFPGFLCFLSPSGTPCSLTISCSTGRALRGLCSTSLHLTPVLSLQLQCAIEPAHSQASLLGTELSLGPARCSWCLLRLFGAPAWREAEPVVPLNPKARWKQLPIREKWRYLA